MLSFLAGLAMASTCPADSVTVDVPASDRSRSASQSLHFDHGHLVRWESKDLSGEVLWEVSGKPLGWASPKAGGGEQRFAITREQGRIQAIEDRAPGFEMTYTFAWDRDERVDTTPWFATEDQSTLHVLHLLTSWPATIGIGGGVGQATVAVRECHERRGCTDLTLQATYDTRGRATAFDWTRRGVREITRLTYEEDRLVEVVVESSRNDVLLSTSRRVLTYDTTGRLASHDWRTTDADGAEDTRHHATIVEEPRGRRIDSTFHEAGKPVSRTETLLGPCR
ncbi:MAG: hypothetical protein R3F61_30390 [Myxococcota bacterium]